MIPPRFDYVAPSSVDEAIAILHTEGDEAKILSGGQSLLPLLKLRLASPRVLVDINRIPGLDRLREDAGMLRIGALVRESDVEASAIVRARYPLLADTAAVVADPLVRNRATICGNVAHADPANDHPATLLALSAVIVARGPAGERAIAIDDFFTGLFATALQPDEVVVEIRVPTPPPRSGGAYLKLERKVGDFATAAVAVQVTLAADGVVERAGIGLTNVGPMPIRARQAEARLAGQRPDDAVLKDAARLAAADAQPVSDRRGSADYKRDVVRVLAYRALRRAVERAG
ncbi:MAG TPA: xanthine dehydrogenase family protein subunit M [Longimicrobiales bacterium]|nr:xanthine dehydrogenase family protein subunit M [Longimicrobiales bacterium]